MGRDPTDQQSPGGDGTDADGAVARLARLEAQFAEIQRLAQLGSWEWNIRTDVVTWSDELYRIYGVEPGEFDATYEAFLDRVHADDRAMVHDTVQQAYADRASYAFDHRLVRPDGSVRWLHGRGNVLADEAGAPERLFGIAIDITERKRSEQLLRDFIANASHELRTPVAAISQAAHVLAFDSLSDEDRTFAMEALTRQAERLRDLFTNLLDLTALEDGTRPVMLGPVSLGASVHAAAAACPGIDPGALTVDVGPELSVLAEPTDLERVLVNLLVNAFEHGGRTVSVSARRRGAEVVVDVADDGPGVPEDDLSGLFAPFGRRRTGSPGSGLGLAIVHRLMVAFGGTISYRPAAPTGAVFTLRFASPPGGDPDHRG